MAGLNPTIPDPTDITVHAQSRVLEVGFADGRRFRFPFEFLRVWSPSAEVQGHGPGQEVLQAGKREVRIAQVEPVGHYAIRLAFDDGHDTGLYSWDYLLWLGEHQDRLWADYLRRLADAQASRDPTGPVGAAAAGRITGPSDTTAVGGGSSDRAEFREVRFRKDGPR